MTYLEFILGNRRFLVFGVAAAALSGFGQTFFISLFGGQIRAGFDLSHGEFGALYSAATLVSGLSIVSAGRQMDRMDLRAFAALVTLGVAMGCLLMATAGTVWLVALAMFLLRLTGQGLMTHMAFTSMGRFFETGRGKAVSIAGMGMPLAEAALPPLAVAVTAAAGWRGTWALAAGFMLVVALPLLQGLLSGHGARKRWLHDRTGAEVGTDSAGPRQWRRGEVLRDPRFYLLLPAVLAAPLIVTALFFHQVHVAEAKGWELSWLAASFTAFAATHVVGLLVFGEVVDRAGARGMLPYFLLPMAGGLVVLATFADPWAAWPYMALMGLTMGGTGTVLGALWPELYGVAHLGAIRAVVQAAMVLSTAVSPVAAGVLLDQGWSVTVLALVLCAYIAVATALAVVALRLPVVRYPGSSTEV
ncbi:MFS transporter [Thiohalorhabdus sp.]|uniref:MFS transporter n=1 Tax=Thiohalorhabdus sp. TaxID=3094134 RepID=UPI002FC3C69D